ncbi:sporulation integral membrane protein YtvI [Chakrabartyella piscis]|uniref:sporulation integral membrane protein YtvI n=1 Tax=Chakrabartyella piscis TaxID=2918914 RepID=UPI002958608B|nr:sporulation integral membrane protein YtvI [Chakrabartyella piscis]
MYLDQWKQNKQLYPVAMLLGSALCFVVFFKYLFPIVAPFFVGWLLSLLFRPLVKQLDRIHFPRGISALLSILLLLGGISFLGYFIGNQLYIQMQTYVANVPQYLEQLEVAFSSIWNQLQTYLVVFPDFLTDFITNGQENFFSFLFSHVPSGEGASAISIIPNFFLQCIISLFSAYFFTKDEEKIQAFYQTHIAPILGESYTLTKKELLLSLGGYIKTQFILMGYVFVICFIGFLVLQSPYALLLSILIAIIDAIPVFGSGFILWPAIALQLVNQNYKLAIGYVILYLILQLTRQILQPKILGNQIGLHPLPTFFAMFFGFKTIGVFGLILGPIYAVVLVAYCKNKES